MMLQNKKDILLETKYVHLQFCSNSNAVNVHRNFMAGGTAFVHLELLNSSRMHAIFSNAKSHVHNKIGTDIHRIAASYMDIGMTYKRCS